MGLVERGGYDSRVVDRSDDKFTDISSFADRWMTGALNTDDAYYSQGFQKYDIVSPLKSGTISVGDFVSIQNRAGVVTALIMDSPLDPKVDGADGKVDGNIIGVTVMEDMRYLPKEWRANPTGYGYDASGVGMSRTYVFGKDSIITGATQKGGAIPNGGGNRDSVPFRGSLMILKQNKAAESTWNNIMKAVAKKNLTP